MSVIVSTWTCSSPPFSEEEALRYAGCRGADEGMRRLLLDCAAQAEEQMAYRVCYGVLSVCIQGDCCDFANFSVYSRQLAKNLDGCTSVLLFGATVGVGIDRLIAKYGRISPARAVMLQGIGAERIEALCDAFCRNYAEENDVGLRPRFSPGYGDLPLEVQKSVFAVLDCPRKIGLSLSESLLMSPSKSVTAFAGITHNKRKSENNGCGSCENTGCSYRSEQ